MRLALARCVTLGIAVLLAGCQVDPAPAGSGDAASSRPNATDGVDPAMTVGPGASPTSDGAAPADLDPGLLDYLPATVGGVVVTEALDEAAAALTDPDLGLVATALDVGVAVDQASGNLVTAHVVRLREAVFTDELYRQWRDSFDDGACAAAGGVGGHLETTIAERPVFITTCAGGLRTYHTWIADQDLLVSAASVGSGRFGEELMGTLRIPE